MYFSKLLIKNLLFVFLILSNFQNSKAEITVPSNLLIGGGVAVGAGLGLLVGPLLLEGKINQLSRTLEEKLIEQWIVQNNLNCYGEPKDTYYEQGSPLNKYQTRFNYIKDKFIKKPWLKGYKNIFTILRSSKNLIDRIAGIGFSITLISILASPFVNLFYSPGYQTRFTGI